MLLQDDDLHFNPDGQEGLQRNLDSEGLQVVGTSHLMQPYHSVPQDPEEFAGIQPYHSIPEDREEFAGMQPYHSVPQGPKEFAVRERVKTNIRFTKERIIWLVCVISILAMVGSVAAGVGIVAAEKRTKNDRTSSADANTASISTTATSPASTASTAASTTTNTDSTTSTASSTSSAVTSGVTGMAQNPCPAANQTTITASSGNLFTLYCGVDWPNGIEAASDNGTVQDLEAFTVYNLTSCIEECVSYNQQQNESPCKAVEYQANLTSALGSGEEGNCFLKSQVGKYSPASFGGMAAGVVGG